MVPGVLLLWGLVLAGTGKVPLAVMPVAIKAPMPAPEDASTLLTSMLTDALAQTQAYDVLSADDVASLLGQERDAQAIGCDSPSCYSEVADALGARVAVVGNVSRAGDMLVWNIQVVQQEDGAVVRSAQTQGARVDELVAQVTELAMVLAGDAEATELRGEAVRRRLGFTDDAGLAAFAAYREAHKDRSLQQALTDHVIANNVESNAVTLVGTSLLVVATAAATGAVLSAGAAIASFFLAGAFAPGFILGAMALGTLGVGTALGGVAVGVLDQLNRGRVEVRADGCCRDGAAIRAAARKAINGRLAGAVALGGALGMVVAGPFLPLVGVLVAYGGYIAAGVVGANTGFMMPAGAPDDFGFSPVVGGLGAGAVILMLLSPPMVLITGTLVGVLGAVALVRGDPPVLLPAAGRSE